MSKKDIFRNIGLTIVLLCLFSISYNQANAGGTDQDLYQCKKVKTCPVKTKIIKVPVKKVVTKTVVIERPVQQIVERTKTVTVKVPVKKVITKTVVKKELYTHKNRISVLIGQGYKDDAEVFTTVSRDMYGNLLDKKFDLHHKKNNNITLQYMRDLYIRPNFSIHGVIQIQTINGAQIGLGIGF